MFELIIESLTGSDLFEIEGTLVSPLLDPAMHRDRSVGLHIATKSALRNRKASPTLDSFQIDSLREYLRLQKRVRRILEQELPKDQIAIDPDGDPVSCDLWSWARVRQLKLRARDLQTPGMVRRLKEAGRTSREIREELLPTPEKLETKSVFVVSLECDWCRGRLVDATFRDGRFVSLE